MRPEEGRLLHRGKASLRKPHQQFYKEDFIIERRTAYNVLCSLADMVFLSPKCHAVGILSKEDIHITYYT